MKTTEDVAKEYAIKNPNATLVEAFREGYTIAFAEYIQESALKERSFEMALSRVHSFHKQAIMLIERAMKELE